MRQFSIILKNLKMRILELYVSFSYDGWATDTACIYNACLSYLVTGTGKSKR